MTELPKKKQKTNAYGDSDTETEQMSDDEYNDSDSYGLFGYDLEHNYAETPNTQRTSTQRTTSENTLTTVIITSDQVNIAKVHPIKLKNELTQILGNINTIKIHNANILLKLSKEQTTAIQQTRKILNYNINVKVQQSQPNTKGIIHGVSLELGTEEIIHTLKEYNVITATRLGKNKDSETVILKFSTNTLPYAVNIGFKTHKVKTYIPPPIRCYNCNKFGHTSTYCTTKVRCPKCGGNHPYQQCKSTDKKCPNCGESHNAAYKGCIQYKEAKYITEYKIKNNTTYTQAKKEIQKQNSHSSPTPTYAQILKGTLTTTQLNNEEKSTLNTPPQTKTTASTSETDIINVIQAAERHNTKVMGEQLGKQQLHESNPRTTTTTDSIYTFIVTTSAIMAAPVNQKQKARTIAAIAQSLLETHVQIEAIEETFTQHQDLYAMYENYNINE